jgi:hypothetical protein
VSCLRQVDLSINFQVKFDLLNDLEDSEAGKGTDFLVFFLQQAT